MSEFAQSRVRFAVFTLAVVIGVGVIVATTTGRTALADVLVWLEAVVMVGVVVTYRRPKR